MHSKRLIASPTNREIQLPDNAFITSKTDLAGKITYGNSLFIEISGYPESCLLGAPQSIVRHPDMPRGVFHLLWETIKRGQEFVGYVKNMTADGSFYWVLATVTPDFDEQKNIKGFYSVRRRPKRAAIQCLEAVYRQMQQAESAVGKIAQPQTGIEVLHTLIKDKGIASYEDFVLAL